MTTHGTAAAAQLQRELAYYRRECNDLGARLLRLQEEQSQAFRDARRSRTTAKLMREAYRLSDSIASVDAMEGALLEVIVDNAMCDRAAFLSEAVPGSGDFTVTHIIGAHPDPAGGTTHIDAPPAFFFTTSQTRLEPTAYALTGILKLPYILWAYDRATGRALIFGNRSESNVSRPFEEGDQELIEGALSVYLDVLARKQAELQLQRAKRVAEDTVEATMQFLGSVGGAFRTPLNSIIGNSERMSSGSRYPLTIDRCTEFADHIHESGIRIVSLINDILEYTNVAKRTLVRDEGWRPLPDLFAAFRDAGPDTLDGVALSVHMSPACSGLDVFVDGHGLLQALKNLVRTAARAAGPQGGVGLRTGTGTDGSVVIEVAADLAQPIPAGANGAGYPRDLGFAHTDMALPLLRALIDAHDGTLHVAESGDAVVGATIILPAGRVRKREPDVTAPA